MTSNIAKGSKYEKKVKQDLENAGYIVHRASKATFGTQDLFGIGDCTATRSDDFVIVACAVGRYQTATVEKIKAMRPHLPKSIRVEYRVLLPDGREKIREFS